MSVAAPEIAVVDTHALIWWLAGDFRKLGRNARAFCSRVDEGRAVAVFSAETLVEVSEAVSTGHVDLFESFDTVCERLASTPSRYLIVPLTMDIVRRSHDLYVIPERGDRLTAATALALGFPMVTRDPAITKVLGTRSLW